MRTIITMLVMLFAACNLSAQYTIRIDPGQQGKRGALPPVWLKNKLTDGQYDSLAMLAKHYAVDNSFSSSAIWTRSVSKSISLG